MKKQINKNRQPDKTNQTKETDNQQIPINKPNNQPNMTKTINHKKTKHTHTQD